MLPRILMPLILFLGMSLLSTAQQVAVVDVSAVLESMDEYTAAQQELDRVAATWQQEIAQEYDKIKSLYNKYQAEQVLLSDEMKKQRQLVDRIKKRLASELGVSVDVKLVEEKTLERFEGKGQRVIDKREL